MVRTRSRVQIPLSAPSGTETIRCLFLRYFFYPANTNKNVLSVLRSLTKTFLDGRRHDSRIRAISIIFIVKGNLFEKLSFLSRLKSARNGTLIKTKKEGSRPLKSGREPSVLKDLCRSETNYAIAKVSVPPSLAMVTVSSPKVNSRMLFPVSVRRTYFPHRTPSR